MTVCIAAICEADKEPRITFCADRLVTDSNGLTFEQGKPKVDIISDNCFVMNAGLGHEADEIIDKVASIVSNEYSHTYPCIKIIAGLFKEYHQKKRDEVVNDEILKPRGFTLENIYVNLKSLPEWLAFQIDSQIVSFKLEVNFLIMGFDIFTLEKDGEKKQEYAPRLYMVNELGEIQSLTSTGFGIIGIGNRMSLPEITKQSYSAKASLSESLVRLYWAKKSAERVIGVGNQTTDLGLMWVDEDTDGNLIVKNSLLQDDVQEDILKQAFDEYKEKVGEMDKNLQAKMDEILSGEKKIERKPSYKG